MPSRASTLCIFAVLAWWGVAPGPDRELRADEQELFWSFRPVRAVAPPPVRLHDWPQAAIDRFILSALEERGMEPAPPADRRTLIRRATFDLTGLPPTPGEIAAFLADESPEAFARVVERLLASPRYGERWGRHWLDVVRYADARDLIQLPAESDFREAWRYRDWVVSAFNRDLPYDEFVAQQVAGDLLQPADRATIDAAALVATGMLAIADFVPGDVDKQQMIADYVNDQIDVVGRAFLGLTLACARCHDHKFDPISTEDYYSLAGIFFSTRLIPGPVKGNTPLVRVPLVPAAEIAAREAGQRRDAARLAELSREVATLAEREYRAHLQRRVAEETARYLLAAWEFAYPPAGQERSLPGFAKERQLEEGPLSRWLQYFTEPSPHPSFAAVRGATDPAAGKERVLELSKQIAKVASDRLDGGTPTGGSASEADAEILRFQGRDRRLVKNNMQQVTLWPNRGRAGANATPVPDVAVPATASILVAGTTQQMLRFTGKEMLQAPAVVPPAGTLFVVYRPDPQGGPGQRLVGWEDSSVGQHGLGIMLNGAGAVHVILRRDGANGDVVVPAPAPATAPRDFQVLCVTWGPGGVAVFRNGEAVGANRAVDSVSSDPAITALRIGGPGSGSSPRFQGDIAELRVYTTPLDDAARTRIGKEMTARWSSAATARDPADAVADLYDELLSSQGPFQLEAADREKALAPAVRERLAAMREELESLKKKPPLPEIPQAVVVQEGGPPGTPHEGFHDAVVYLRGNHQTPGKTVPRGVPRVVAGAEPPVVREGSGRRELARWLADPANPLTARVMANRVWQHHFGAGLVRTSANFGAMGERPSHPELLDYLAAQFVASGWSVKALHRLIMLSSTYQQSSGPGAASSEQRQFQQGQAADPENRLLWRANRRRLESEAARDAMLAVAGRLDSTPGGPGFQDAAIPRRTLYLMAVRTGAKAAEFGPLFDAPDCSGIVERRTESITAPQALFLINDPLMTDLARGLAERVLREAVDGTRQDQIRRLYEITLGRLPLGTEIELALEFLGEDRDNGAAGRPSKPHGGVAPAADAWVRYCHLLLCTNEFLYVD
jgi:hypothetical protein